MSNGIQIHVPVKWHVAIAFRFGIPANELINQLLLQATRQHKGVRERESEALLIEEQPAHELVVD